MAPPLHVSFVGGDIGPWRVESITEVVGEGLPLAARLELIEQKSSLPVGSGTWALRGTVGNLRYTTRDEAGRLVSSQEGLGRGFATRAALIPIKKNDAWWSMAQDERRAIFEESSKHIAIGLEYLPAIARRLHHSRELGEPFDFLTWFEYAPDQSAAFEAMVGRLRATPEWSFVDREVDIRLSHNS